MAAADITAARFTAALAGASERPDAGDPDAHGTATIAVDENKGEVCYDLAVTGMKATAAHIHEGGPNDAGPIVVNFTPPGPDGKSQGCTKPADKDSVTKIVQKPSAYYVNVHSAEFPQGAVRGQLGPS